MKGLFEKASYLAYVGVISLLLASVAAFGWGALKTFYTVRMIVLSYGKDPGIAVSLIAVVDAFLIATALFVFTVSMYELFIGDLSLPDWMLAHNLHGLEQKLGGAIILVMVVKFLEYLVEWQNAYDSFLFSIAVALVSASIIALVRFGDKN